MATRALTVLLTGDSTQLKKSFDSAVASATKAQAGLAASGASIERTGRRISGVGKTLNRNVTLPIAALGAVSIKAAVDFEASMRNVNSIAGLSEKKFASLSKEVKGLAGETAQSPQTLAEGLYDLVSSGFEADEAMTVLKASAKGASAGLTTTEVSAKAVAATLNAYHRPAKEAGKVTDDLFETVNRGVVSFEELSSSIGYVLPTAATMGITLKEVGAAISTLTKEGQSGDTAITNINQAVTAFIKPSKAMKSALKSLGVETSEQLIKQKGFQGALEAVAGTTEGTKEELGKLFGNVRAQRAVFGLLGKNVKTAKEDIAAFNDDAGRTNQVLSEQKKSTAYQWRQLKAEAQDLAITFGEDLVPVLKQIVGDVKGVVQGFTNLPEGTQKAIVEFGLVAAAAGPVVRTVGALTTGVGALVKVTGGLVGAGRTVAEFGQVFGTSLSAGQGFFRSLSIAGESAAPTLMKGLTKGLPVAAAAAGIGNIIYSATQGDWKDAGFKAGGALAGGIAGALVGGPMGAALGVGIGSALGGVLGGLFDSEKKLTPLQEKLAAQSDHAADAFKRQRDAAHGLAGAQDAVHAANRRSKQSTEAVTEAHKKLNSAVKKFGPDSQQAHQAEIDLAKAQHRDATTAEEAKKAHQLAGNQLRLYRHNTVEAVASEKERLPNLEAIVKHLQRRSSQEKGNIPLLERTVQKEEQLAKVNHRVNALISEAAQTAGPKFARMLRNMTTEQAEFGTHYRGLLKLVPEFGKKTETTTQKAEHAFGHWTDVFSQQTGKAKADVRNWSRVTNSSGESVVRKLNESLSALGVKEVMWGGAKKQRGGPINLGAPSGDSVPALLERGEYVLNRNAVNKVGTSTLDAINFQMAPRHQTGGAIGAEPRLSGTDPLRTGGQHAIHAIYSASKKYYNQHSGKARVIANGSRMDGLHQPYLWGGGHGPSADPNGPWDCSGGISELFDGAGWNFPPMVSSGFESWGLPGKGEVSVLANADHVYAVVEGKGAIGTSESNPGGGFGWISGYTFRPGFTIRHADFSEQALSKRTSGNRGRGQKARKGFQSGGLVVSGKASYEGGTGNGTSDGQHTDEDPGFAIRDTSTLGDWFWVKVGGAEGLLQHTDWGPAEWTGRAIDFTAAGLRKIGAPLSITDTEATVEWAGHTVASAMQNLGRDGRGGGQKAKRVKPKLGNAVAVEIPGLKPSRLLPSAKGLSKSIRNALRAPGLHYSGKVSLGESAYSRAQETAGTEDNLAVLDFQEELFGKNKKRLQKKLKQLDSQLKKRQSPQERRRTLGERQHVEEELGATSGNLAGARSSRKELNAQAREAQEERKEREREERAEREQREREEPRKRAELGLARAEETKNTKSDDISALQELKKVAEDELHYAESTGNLEDITNATRNLTQATENLKNLAVEAFEEQTEGELALAELTESLSDDLAILHRKLSFAEEQLSKAEAEGNWAEIAKWAHEVKGLTDAIKSDEGAEASAQMAEEMKALREEMQKNREIAESIQGTSAAAAWKALSDQFAGYLGPKAIRQTALPGNGGVGSY
jgi:TP901 family phage tail tape measure protein